MMARENQRKHTSADLRRRAEARMSRGAGLVSAHGDEDLRRLVHELDVHRVELELQNEELRRARDELENNYNELYNFAPVGYFTLGRDAEIENLNLTGAGMLGQPATLLLGRSFSHYVAPESLARFNAFVRCVLEGVDRNSCIVTLAKNGNIPVIVHMEARGAGADCPNWRVTVVDISSAELARLALQDSEERLKLALDVANMGVWEWECYTSDLYWSPECMAITGVDCLCPTLDMLALLLHPDDARSVEATLRDLHGGATHESIETRIVRPDGTVAWIFMRIHVQRDADGKPRCLLGIVQDITERKLAAQSTSPTPGHTAG